MSSVDAVAAVRAVHGLVDGWVAVQRWYRQVPGVVVGVSVGDETVFTCVHGLADVENQIPVAPSTRFRIASHSKVFTATAILMLVEQGRLRLDDRIVDHLEWFGTGTVEDELAHVTVRQVLSHSAGLTRDGETTHWLDDRFPSVDELIAQVATMSVYGTAEHLKYSNIGFTVLGQVVESVTGQPYEQHVAEAILEPLRLDATTPDLPDDLGDHARGYPRWLPGRERPAVEHVGAKVMNSATGFSSTVDDLLRWYRAHRLGSGELLADRTKREMQRLQFEGEEIRWGLGFSLDEVAGFDFVTHGGGYPGFITFSGIEQEHGLAIVVLTNAGDGAARALFDGVAKLAAKAIAGDYDGDPPFDPATADAVTGFYEHRWGISQVARVGAKLMILDPVSLDPTAGLSVLDHVEDWSFRYPTTHPIGSPGETVRFDPGPPPVMHDPSTPPIERTDTLLD